MEYKIRKCNYKTAKDANKLLTMLISDEKKYDENINENCVVKSLYEKFYNDDGVYLYIAESENNTVGYIYGYVQNNGDAKKDVVCVLDALYVLKEYRNNGIATKLIDSFLKWCKDKDAHYIELKVCNPNLDAIKLYKKFRFVNTKMIMVKNMGDTL